MALWEQAPIVGEEKPSSKPLWQTAPAVASAPPPPPIAPAAPAPDPAGLPLPPAAAETKPLAAPLWQTAPAVANPPQPPPITPATPAPDPAGQEQRQGFWSRVSNSRFRPDFWKRFQDSFIVGINDYAANALGSTLQAAIWDKESSDSGITPEYIEQEKIRRIEKAKAEGKPIPVFDEKEVKSWSENAQTFRKQIRSMVDPERRKKRDDAANAPIPGWDNPLGFIDAGLNMIAGNVGNLTTSKLPGPAGMAIAYSAISDQEAGGFAQTWAETKGLPIDFVAPYAKAYGLVAGVVEYVQSAAIMGGGVAGKYAKKIPGVSRLIPTGSLMKSIPVKLMLKALDVNISGGEEVTQAKLEYKVASKMVEEWNKQNPDKKIDIPEWTSDDFWNNYKGGLAMQGLGEVTRGVKQVAGGLVDRARVAADQSRQREAAADILENAGNQPPPAVQPQPPPAVQPPPLPGQPPVAPNAAPPPVATPPPPTPLPEPVIPSKPKIQMRVERIEAPIEPIQINPDDATQIQAVQQSGAVVNNFPLDKLNFDPGRFQYKLGSGESGQTGTLKGVKKYDKLLGGVLSVWYDPEKGRVYIVNGHNRGAKAKELGEKDHAVRFIDAPDAQSARAVGALMNIAEGNGTPVDAAKFFRDSGFTQEEIEARGLPMTAGTVSKGLALSKLTPGIFNSIVQKEMTEAIGVAIGNSGLSHPQQTALIGLMERAADKHKLDASDVSALADEVKDAPVIVRDNNELELFPTDPKQESIAVERARVVSSINKRLTADRRLFSRVSTRKTVDRLQKAGNQIDADNNRAISDDAAVIQEVFNTLKKSVDMAAILNRAAEEVHNGAKFNKTVDQAYEGIRIAVSEAIGKSAGDSLARSQQGKQEGNLDAQGEMGQAEADKPAEPPVIDVAGGAAPAPARQLTHWTSPESAKALRAGSAFDTGRAPIHGFMAGNGENFSDDRFAGPRLYLSLDDQRWNSTVETDKSIPARKIVLGDKTDDPADAVFFDYQAQQWMVRKGAQRKRQLEAVSYDVSGDAKTLVIDGSEALQKAEQIAGVAWQVGDVGANVDFWNKIQAAGYDVVEIRNVSQNEGKGFFDSAGGDTAVVLNPAKVSVSPTGRQGSFFSKTTASYGGAATSVGRDTISDGPRIDRLGSMDVPTDDPHYTRLPVGLTDGVRLLKQLGASIRLSRAKGKWAGQFRGDTTAGRPGPMEILLRHELFQLVTDKRKRELKTEAQLKAESHPLFAAMDPAAQAALSETLYREQYQIERAAALKRGAPEALAVVWHEIGHLIGFYSEGTLQRGNLLGHLAALKNYQDHMIQGVNSRGRAITKKERDAMQNEAEKAAGPRPKNPADQDAWRARKSEEYKRRIREEADRRGLIVLEELDEETQGLIAWWNGKPDMPTYFKSAAERYAEVFSVLVNNPRAVEQKAPKFWRAWNEFLVLRPEASAAWDQMQSEVANGSGATITEKELRQMVVDADKAQRSAFFRNARNLVRTRIDQAITTAFRTQGPIDWVIMQADNKVLKSMGVPWIKRVAPGSAYLTAAAEAAGTTQVREAIDDWRYATSKAEPYYQDMSRLIEKLANDGLVSEFKLYMMLRHIVEDRSDIASPVDPSRAIEILNNMRTRAPETIRKMDEAHDEWYAIRAKHMINLVGRLGMFNMKQMNMLRERESYVTFLVKPEEIAADDPAGLIREMENVYGREASKTLGFQRGWLGEISDPIAATIQKDRKLIRAAMRNEAARRLAEFLIKQQTENPRGRPLIEEAKKVNTTHGPESVFIGDRNPHMGDLTFLLDGKLNHYYVPKAFASFLNGSPAGQELGFVQTLNALTINPLKRAFVEWAPGAWPILGVKDLHAYIVQTPGVNVYKKLSVIGSAWQAARTIERNRPNDLAKSAQERTMIGSRLERKDDWDPSESAIQRELAQFGRRAILSEEAAVADRQNYFRTAGRAYMEWANRNNRIWTHTLKIAGMKYLDNEFPTMAEWKKKELVRVVAGNPDFWHRAGGASLADWSMLYYNAAKEGRMAAIKAMRENPRDYFVNSLIYTAAPSALMGMMAAGMVSSVLRGLTDSFEWEWLKEYEEKMKWIPSYEKERSLCWPLWWEDPVNKRVAYLRLPVSEGQQWAHSLAYRAFAGGNVSPGQILAGTGMLEMQPGNPVINIAGAWLKTWQGRNPPDPYRGGSLFSDDEWKAGGAFLYRRLVEYTYDNVFSAMFGRFNRSGPYAPERSTFEKFVQLKGVSATLGRWIRVSSGFDEPWRQITQEAEKPRAIARLTVQQAVKKKVATGRWDLDQLSVITKDPYAMEYLAKYTLEYELRKSLPPEVQRIIMAGNDELRAKALTMPR